MTDDAFARGVIDAVFSAVDPARLRRELARVIPPAQAPVAAAAHVGKAHERPEILERFVLADLLDEAILGARPGDKPFPLRLLLSHLGERLDDEAAFAFAGGLNFFFRAEMDEELKMRVGIQVSAQYYDFVASPSSGLEANVVPQISPLLAELMSTELARVKLESVDHQHVFDSASHERVEGSHAASSAIRPASFLCRVTSTRVVRARALVRT